MPELFYGVLTTVQLPTDAVRRLVSRLRENNAELIVVGDKKGPAAYDLTGTDYFSLTDQLELDFEIARKLPVGHYARKNIGYLMAASRGASSIYETDDDNAPLPNWTSRPEMIEAVPVTGDGWINVYRFFSDENIWPRGFPLEALRDSFRRPELSAGLTACRAPIQQGLANNSPDVDAIWRLVLDRPFDFEEGKSVYLSPGSWCPFNSQSTWWFPVAYPLMYLPSYCSFRMTDIWRSFVAQRCLWELDCGIAFHGPEVVQDRNEHNLLRDFSDEVPGYLGNRKLAQTLGALTLAKGVDALADNLNTCYEALVMAGFFPVEELELLTAWTKDLKQATREKPAASDPLLMNAN
ncbi:MAG TPA: STELLO glycosyltransferase family protein [Pyrinomonadaceae bacterium]|nr:STELLO glycosyltransferase family protein [Pyrinomonadaceae bacterium]